MGLFDNLAKALADRIVKAALAPENTNLPREQNIGSVPFAPGVALMPQAINTARGDGTGRADPRRWEFDVASNINVTSNRLIPFKTLRSAADQIDILRRCIEVKKRKLIGLEWDIVLSNDAIEKVAKELGVTPLQAQQIAKEKYSNDISRLKEFWKNPDPSNGLTWHDWLSMVLEDSNVIDAVAVWPQSTVGGDLKGLQVLDGSTIKPLINERGMRPEAPHPAFQQILYGFPRNEFAAATVSEETDGDFSADELAYFIRNKRTFSTWGYSPVERSLSLATLYLLRQQWIRAEYTDGVLPELMFKTGADFTADQKRAWENVFNDDLAGQTEQRHRATILPQGFEPIIVEGYAEKLNNMVLDDFFITAICGHFDVQPTEIGMMPKSGLGGKGMHEGQAESSEVIGTSPDAVWLAGVVNQLSYSFAGMPRELEFRFIGGGRKDELSRAQADQILINTGVKSRNEARADRGLSLLAAEEADLPTIITTAGAWFISEDGLVDFTNGGVVDAVAEGESGDAPAEVEAPVTEKPTEEPKPVDNPAIDEAKKFVRWLRKSPTRPFDFQVMPHAYAETLNKFVEAQDFEGAKLYAEFYIR